MNLQKLICHQPIYNELKVINRKIMVDNVWIEVLGFTLYNKELKLYALEYDETSWLAQRNLGEEGLEEEIQKIEYNIPFLQVREMIIDGKVLEVSGGSSGRVEQYNFKSALLINEFIRAGYCPTKALETVDFAGIMLTRLSIVGEYDAIPVVDNPKEITLIQSKGSRYYPVKKSLSLEINKAYPDAFKCGEGEERVEFYIDKVYLMDYKTEAKKIYESPEVISRMSPEELASAKLEIEKYTQQLCPEGMLLPVIEYESERASLQMELKMVLKKRKLSKEATAMGIVMRPDRKIGEHGLPLRAIALEAVPEDTEKIDVGIVGYSVMVAGKVIEI